MLDLAVVALASQATYLFRLGFERRFSARPGYDHWVLLGFVAHAADQSDRRVVAAPLEYRRHLLWSSPSRWVWRTLTLHVPWVDWHSPYHFHFHLRRSPAKRAQRWA